MPWSEPSPHSSMPGSGRACRRAGPRPDDPRRQTACGARPAPSARPVDGKDRRSAPRTPDTRHCDAVSPGTGKTHIATALGVQAVEHHHKRVRFFSTVELVNALEQEKVQGRAGQIAGRLAHSDLVILDELGYLPFSASGGALLFHLLSRLYERTSVAITTNLSFSEWATVFGEPKLSCCLHS